MVPGAAGRASLSILAPAVRVEGVATLARNRVLRAVFFNASIASAVHTI